MKRLVVSPCKIDVQWPHAQGSLPANTQCACILCDIHSCRVKWGLACMCMCRRVQNLFHSVSLNVNNPHFLIMQGRITKVRPYCSAQGQHEKRCREAIS